MAWPPADGWPSSRQTSQRGTATSERGEVPRGRVHPHIDRRLARACAVTARVLCGRLRTEVNRENGRENVGRPDKGGSRSGGANSGRDRGFRDDRAGEGRGRREGDVSRSGERPGRRPGKAPRQGERWDSGRGRGRDERGGRWYDRGQGGGRRGRDDDMGRGPCRGAPRGRRGDRR